MPDQFGSVHSRHKTVCTQMHTVRHDEHISAINHALMYKRCPSAGRTASPQSRSWVVRLPSPGTHDEPSLLLSATTPSSPMRAGNSRNNEHRHNVINSITSKKAQMKKLRQTTCLVTILKKKKQINSH